MRTVVSRGSVSRGVEKSRGVERIAKKRENEEGRGGEEKEKKDKRVRKEGMQVAVAQTRWAPAGLGLGGQGSSCCFRSQIVSEASNLEICVANVPLKAIEDLVLMKISRR